MHSLKTVFILSEQLQYGKLQWNLGCNHFGQNTTFLSAVVEVSRTLGQKKILSPWTFDPKHGALCTIKISRCFVDIFAET